jgi:hypothetical protein
MNSFPTPQNSFSPRKTSVNLNRSFFSVNFIQICTKNKLGCVYRIFLPGMKKIHEVEKDTWRWEKNSSYFTRSKVAPKISYAAPIMGIDPFVQATLLFVLFAPISSLCKLSLNTKLIK